MPHRAPRPESSGSKIEHVGFSDVLGIIPDVAGTLTFDPANVNASKLSVTIQPESLNSISSQRDTYPGRSCEVSHWHNAVPIPHVQPELDQIVPAFRLRQGQ